MFTDKFKFDVPSILKLISLRTEYQPKFISSKYRNHALWAEISVLMDKAGHKATAKQCEDKIDRLMDQYKNFEDNRNNLTGNNVERFAYDKEMSEFMGDWPTVHPESLISFGCINQNMTAKKEEQ